MNHVKNRKITTHRLLSQFLVSSNKETNEMLLDSFVEEAMLIDNYSFSDGLLGAGWLISYLIKHKILVCDVDEILYDVDDLIYKLTIKAVINSETTIEELLQLISYYQQRLLNKSKTYNIYRHFALIECLKLLVDKTLSTLSENSLILAPLEKSRVLLKFSYLVKTCFNEKEIEIPFYNHMEDLIFFYKKMKPDDFKAEDEITLCYLQLTSKQYENPYWVNCVMEIIKSIEIQNQVASSLIKVADLYNPNDDNYVSIELFDFIQKYDVIFLLANNLKSLKFK
ncbi:hypothetical protein [Sphingobacterium sp.]|uniref:hypothetical protein n=1 Tax=Sphingobacterium sp. TaxID=341027 RepID=UPI002582F17F|nr:hypothetical protein [Sphingobacterium sp.]WET69767.1 MAG: hypothetical protein P0Y57_01500 [Sphingobacterium sp.]